MTWKFIPSSLAIPLITSMVACGGDQEPSSRSMLGVESISSNATVSSPSTATLDQVPDSRSTAQAQAGFKVQDRNQPSTETSTVATPTSTLVESGVSSGSPIPLAGATVNDGGRTDSRDGDVGNEEDSGEGSKFVITSGLCEDDYGPQCTKLRLGDDYLTTSTPRQGYLYSCTGKNPDAPGSDPSKITWIDRVNQTWNFFKKLWLPQGTFQPEGGSYTETISGSVRHITVNNLPLDGMIGDWPMTNYPQLTEIDRNPGVPATKVYEFSYPVAPSRTVEPLCTSLGAVGVTRNGVVIYSAIDGRGEDAVAREIVDAYGGHPAQSDYHYHFIPERLDNGELEDGHSGVVGYINDGFPIYGYKGQGGIEMSNEDLDLCHGHEHGILGYHYHATLEYPYTIGCYRGDPGSNSSALAQTQGQHRPPPEGRPRR
jgi:hypothetical protein